MSTISIRRNRVPHEWDRWFRRKQFRLIRGLDFAGMPHAMGVQVRTAAKKRGISVSVFIEGDTLIVTRR